MDVHYENDDTGGFLLVFDGETFGPYETVGIACSVCDGQVCLHKHGDFRKIKAWFEKTKKAYEAGGLGDLAAELRLVEVCNCPIETLNHFIGTAALPESWLDRLQPSVPVANQEKGT